MLIIFPKKLKIVLFILLSIFISDCSFRNSSKLSILEIKNGIDFEFKINECDSIFAVNGYKANSPYQLDTLSRTYFLENVWLGIKLEKDTCESITIVFNYTPRTKIFIKGGGPSYTFFVTLNNPKKGNKVIIGKSDEINSFGIVNYHHFPYPILFFTSIGHITLNHLSDNYVKGYIDITFNPEDMSYYYPGDQFSQLNIAGNFYSEITRTYKDKIFRCMYW